MFKSKDRKPHEVTSARNTKCRESECRKIKSALTNAKAAVLSPKSAACASVSFTSAQAANGSVFRSGGDRDVTK